MLLCNLLYCNNIFILAILVQFKSHKRYVCQFSKDMPIFCYSNGINLIAEYTEIALMVYLITSGCQYVITLKAFDY